MQSNSIENTDSWRESYRFKADVKGDGMSWSQSREISVRKY